MMTKKGMVALLACFACFLWGTSPSGIKVAYSMMQVGADDTMAQILLAGFRFSMAGVLVILTCSVKDKKLLKPAKSSWGVIFVVAMLQTAIQYTIYYIGVAHTSGVRVSVIYASSTFWSILIASLIFRWEKLTLTKIIGCIVGFGGIVLFNFGDDLLGPVTLLGEGFLLFGATFFALSTLLTKGFSAREKSVTVTGYQLLIGGIVLIVIGFLGGGRVHPVSNWGWAVVFYLAFVSAAAYALWASLLEKNPVSSVAGYKLTEPIFGVFVSSIVLSEAGRINWFKSIVALALVCIGIYIINRPKKEVPETV